MPIPVPVPGTPLAITDAQTARAEALVAKFVQIVKNGTTGGTPTLSTPPTVMPASTNPVIDPLTGLPELKTSELSTPQDQLFFRQLAVALVASVLSESINEVPAGLVNGSNTVFTTSSSFRSGTTRVYLNGARQKPTTHYTESAVNQITFVTAPAGGALLLIDYEKVS